MQKAIQEHEADLKTVAANAAFLAKLEGFTAATMTTLTEKGQLDAEKTIKLADHVRENRAKTSKEEVKLKQQDQEAKEKLAFLQRQLQEKAGGVTRTERDAVIVLDKKAGAGTVKLKAYTLTGSRFHSSGWPLALTFKPANWLSAPLGPWLPGIHCG